MGRIEYLTEPPRSGASNATIPDRCAARGTTFTGLGHRNISGLVRLSRGMRLDDRIGVIRSGTSNAIGSHRSFTCPDRCGIFGFAEPCQNMGLDDRARLSVDRSAARRNGRSMRACKLVPPALVSFVSTSMYCPHGGANLFAPASMHLRKLTGLAALASMQRPRKLVSPVVVSAAFRQVTGARTPRIAWTILRMPAGC